MFENPEIGFRLITVMSWLLIVIGALKMVIWVVGEIWPKAYTRFKSPAVRKFMTGNGNRLLFGLGGLLTALFGGICLALGAFLESVSRNL